MRKSYDNNFKAMICNLIINEKHSTSLTAQQFGIPLKTIENWVTAYNKNKNVFDDDYLSPAQQIDKLKKKIIQLERDNDVLKKTISLLAKKQ